MYQFSYSLDNGNSFKRYAEISTDKIIGRFYTGAYLGFYATSNGQTQVDFADFDWVRYKGFSR